jgi:signal transduction histidine kinase
MSNISARQALVPSNKFDWTKIHLVYFALAAFDLLAIVSGLGLSEWSKTAHKETVHLLDQTNFIRNEISLDQNFAMKLSAISNDIFLEADSRTGERDLNILRSFDIAMSKPKVFLDKLVKKFPFADSSVPVEDGATQVEIQMHQRLNKLDGEVLHSFEKTKTDIDIEIEKMISETQLGLNAYKLGDREKAAAHMSASDNQFRNVLALSIQSNTDLDHLMQKTVDQSEKTLFKSTWLQYLIGGAIFLMIGLACAYALFVGRVLKAKYLELQKAHDDSVENAAMIQEVNEGVTKLNSELADNIKKLSDAQDELVKKGRMEQLGQLTATVAHELRNPLGAVRTSSFLLERKLKDKGMGVESQLLRISNGVSRCDNIITQLLDFSRTSRVTCKETNLDQWLIKVVEDASAHLPNMVAITCDLGLEDRNVPVDATRLERALINMVSNASEAMVGNGTEPSKIVVQSPEIVIRTAIEDDMVVISVADNGPGMSPEILNKVREPLFTTKSFGTGLGIPAVEQIAHQHGGSLDISSAPGQGATFILRIPLQVEQAVAA